MKYTLKTEWLPVAAVILSWVAGVYFYANFPERVITHWNFAGQPDGYSGKTAGAFILPAVLTLMYLFFIFLPLLDPKRERYESFEKVYHVIKMSIIGLLFTIFIISGLVNLGISIPINIVTPFMIGILFIILGNYMGKIKQNWFVGFRVPWTLSSENVWNKTNRLGGWCMMGFGVLLLITPFLPQNLGMWLFIAGIVFVTIVPTVYSYLLYRKEKELKLN